MKSVDLSKNTVNLSKGERVNLSKQSEGLKKIMVGLGWDPAEDTYIETVTEHIKPGIIGRLFGAHERDITREVLRNNNHENIDCDAWLALLEDGKLKDKKNVVYYRNKDLIISGKSVIHHHGDNLTGDGDGDDEQITINLDELPERFDSIVIGVTIYRGKEKNQSFGCIKNTFIRVVDTHNDFEICRFNQSEMAENKDAITFIPCKLYKDKGEWQFKAIGEGTIDPDINAAISHYMY